MPFPLACRVFVKKSADSLMEVPLYVICCFSLVAFNILSLYLIFVSLITMCFGLFLIGFILAGTLCVSWAWLTNFLSHVREVFRYYLFRYFLRSFLSLFSFWEPYNANVGAFNVIRGLLGCFHSFFFILFHGTDFHHFVLQVIYPFFCLSCSAMDSF